MLSDPDWKERIKAAAEGRPVSIERHPVLPYAIEVHSAPPAYNRRFAIEVRPRAGTWSPYFVAVPVREKEIVKPSIAFGPKGSPPVMTMLFMTSTGVSRDGAWEIMSAGNEASPTQSYFVFCDELPSTLVFGVLDSTPQYQHAFAQGQLKDSAGSWESSEEAARAISRTITVTGNTEKGTGEQGP